MTLLMSLPFSPGQGPPLLGEPNPETQIRQSWLKREYRSEKNGEKIGHFLGRKRGSVGQWGGGEMVPRGDQEGDGAYGGGGLVRKQRTEGSQG